MNQADTVQIGLVKDGGREGQTNKQSKSELKRFPTEFGVSRSFSSFCCGNWPWDKGWSPQLDKL